MNAVLQEIAQATRGLGYRPDTIVRDYAFSDVWAEPTVRTRRAPLAVFTQTPPSYRSAAFGAAIGDTRDPESVVRDYRALGAPLFFVIETERVSVWQVLADGPPRLIEHTPLDRVSRLFDINRETWTPDAIHRAKSIARFDETYQLDFVDAGLITAIEGEIHEKLDRLLRESLSVTRDVLNDVSGRVLFQGIFRLLAAKILIDRGHEAATSWDTADVRSVLSGIGRYYRLAADVLYPRDLLENLQGAWAVLSQGLNVANISADDLAFVYENTLVTPQTRREFSTHSTPRHVAEYIVSRLALWRQDAPLPTVFEPFAGAGVFLVSALRHMRDAIPHAWDDKKRHELLVSKIAGADADAFACEVATLSLILADFPNRNGWKIDNLDLFRNGELKRRLLESDVILCNPPFEILTEQERAAYPDLAAISGNKAEAVLTLALESRPKALGFVLPRTFLMDRAYRAQRQAIERGYREIELVSLPDGVFAVSQVESALLIARDRIEPGDVQRIRSSEVDDRDKRRFAVTGLPSRTREETRPAPRSGVGSLWIAPLGPLWKKLQTSPRLGNLVEGHWGLRWSGGRQREAIAEEPREGFLPGIFHSGEHRQFVLGRRVWIDARPDRLYAGHNLPWDRAKILCNAARLSRGNWRLAAAVDRSGLVASQQFIGLWPRKQTADIDLDALAAVLNGPVINAYMSNHSTEKRFRISTLLLAPIPETIPSDLGNLVREYCQVESSHIAGPSRDESLSILLDEIDDLLLQAYDLAPRLERALLASFTGCNRPLTHKWKPWNVSLSDPAVTLSERRRGVIQRSQGDWLQREMRPVTSEEAEAVAGYLP